MQLPDIIYAFPVLQMKGGSTLKSLSQFFLNSLEFLPMVSLKFLPFAAVLLVFVLLLIRKIEAPYGVKSSTYQVVRRLWWMSVTLCATSVYLFAYVLLQPQRGSDIRWLADIKWFEFPRMAEMSHLEGPVVSGLNPMIDSYNGMSGGVNFLGDSIDGIENFRRAYGHMFMQALPFLVYIAISIALLVLLAKSTKALLARASDTAIKSAAVNVAQLKGTVATQGEVITALITQLSENGLIDLSSTKEDDAAESEQPQSWEKPQEEPVRQGVLHKALGEPRESRSYSS